MKHYLGIDVGAVSTKLAVIDVKRELLAGVYLKTGGQPLEAVRDGLDKIEQQLNCDIASLDMAVTGSGRHLVSALWEHVLIKNEITCQAIAALNYLPDVQTVIEIGGQDSKLILIRNGMVTDFAMNTVCAAGTGSFLDHQAGRLGISTDEFGRLAMASTDPAPIGGRCTVFAESDMIHRQQSGYRLPDIIYGLCQRLAANFISNLVIGKEIKAPVVFQGGVACNPGMVKAFQEELGSSVLVPSHPELSGAIGAALLVAKIRADEKGSVY